MGFNYAKEKRQFDKEWKELQKEYADAGMDPNAIESMRSYDWEMFLSRRTYENHTQQLPDPFLTCAEEDTRSTLFQKFIEDSFIPATVSVCAVQRYIKHHNLKGAKALNIRDRKAFEEDAFGKLWQADTCYLPHILEDGRRRRVYCIMIIDDHSRLLVGGGLFYNDNAYNFQKVLKSAVAAYGIPMKLYVDNGSTYTNEQLGVHGSPLVNSVCHDAISCDSRHRALRFYDFSQS